MEHGSSARRPRRSTQKKHRQLAGSTDAGTLTSPRWTPHEERARGDATHRQPTGNTDARMLTTSRRTLPNARARGDFIFPLQPNSTNRKPELRGPPQANSRWRLWKAESRRGRTTHLTNHRQKSRDQSEEHNQKRWLHRQPEKCTKKAHLQNSHRQRENKGQKLSFCCAFDFISRVL